MDYDHELTDDEQRELLRIARATLREFTRTGFTPPGKPHRQTLLDPAFVFVTLRHERGLRGCIGSSHEARPLYKAVQEMAIAAASRDPRFDPVREEELADLTIEISVLGPTRVVTDLREIEIGRHGVCITRGQRRGLLLPQVAIEQGWDAETLVDRVCAKTGLPAGAWRSEDAVIEVFSAQVFCEAPPAES